MTPTRHSGAMLLVAILPLASCAPSPERRPEERAAADVVLAFNEAVTEQDVDAALSNVATGGVQLNLHASHAKMGEEAGLTQDLDALWRTVGAVLFSTLEAYQRTAEPVDVDVDGDVATVWTNTTTVAHGADGDETVLDFTEVYLLLRLDEAWKIAVVANNRPATAP